MINLFYIAILFSISYLTVYLFISFTMELLVDTAKLKYKITLILISIFLAILVTTASIKYGDGRSIPNQYDEGR